MLKYLTNDFFYILVDDDSLAS